MPQWVVVTSLIVAYLGLTLWVGLRAGRGTSSTVDGFVAGDRNFGFLVMYFVTGATVFSAFAFRLRLTTKDDPNTDVVQTIIESI